MHKQAAPNRGKSENPSARTSQSTRQAEKDSASKDRTLEELVMAYRHYVEGLSQQEIANIHGTSVATVSRRLTGALRNGYVHTTVRITPPAEYHEEMLRWIEHPKISTRLLGALNSLGAGLRKVSVCTGDIPPDIERPDAPDNDYRRLKRVAAHAAKRLTAQLLELHNARPKNTEGSPVRLRIGINWGYTMLHVSNEFLANADDALGEIDHVSIGGLCGPFWTNSERFPEFERMTTETGCSTCVQNLSKALPNDPARFEHRIRIPAFLGEELFPQDEPDFDPHEASGIIRQLCHSDPAYSSLYGDKPIFPTTEKVDDFIKDRWDRFDEMSEADHQKLYGSVLRYDLLLTGLSSLDPDASMKRVLTPTDAANLELAIQEEDLCGDIAGHVFDRQGRVFRQGDRRPRGIGNLNSRVTGLWPEDLAQVAKRHQGKPAGGVILVSAGRRKAEALLIATTVLGVANEIVIDTNLAWGLYDLLGLESERDEDFANHGGASLATKVDIQESLESVRDEATHDRYNRVLSDDQLLETYYSRRKKARPVWQIERELRRRGLQEPTEEDEP